MSAVLGNPESVLVGDRELRSANGCLITLNGSQKAYVGNLFHWWLGKGCQRVDRLVLICFQHPPRVYEKLLNEGNCPSYVIYDGYSDPVGWHMHSKKSTIDELRNETVKSISAKEDILNIIETEIKSLSSSTGEPKRIAIMVDSLILMLRHQGLSNVCYTMNKLNRLKEEGVLLNNVLVVVHTDVLQREFIDSINHYSSVMVMLQENKTEVHGQTLEIESEIIIKKKSGKVQREQAKFTLTQDGELRKQANSKAKSILKASEEKAVDPTANISFRLELSESEKEARSQVNLPYTYNQQRKTEHLNRSVGEGKVFYQPDDVDDFDDEDPDDDLDI